MPRSRTSKMRDADKRHMARDTARQHALALDASAPVGPLGVRRPAPYTPIERPVASDGYHTGRTAYERAAMQSQARAARVTIGPDDAQSRAFFRSYVPSEPSDDGATVTRIADDPFHFVPRDTAGDNQHQHGPNLFRDHAGRLQYQIEPSSGPWKRAADSNTLDTLLDDTRAVVVRERDTVVFHDSERPELTLNEEQARAVIAEYTTRLAILKTWQERATRPERIADMDARIAYLKSAIKMLGGTTLERDTIERAI